MWVKMRSMTGGCLLSQFFDTVTREEAEAVENDLKEIVDEASGRVG